MASSGVTVISSPSTIANVGSPKYYSDVCTLAKLASPFVVVKGTNAIVNSVNNILTCPVNTRAWNWTYGSNLLFYLWEPIGDVTATKIQIDAFTSIEKWEPRVTVDTSNSVVQSDTSLLGYNVYIRLLIKATGDVVEYSRSFPLFSN